MSNYFSSNLEFLRKQKGISQNKLAEEVNVNQTTVARWEKKEITPSIDNVEEVAKALNVELPDLLTKDLRLSKEEVLKQSKFHYKDEESGLSVELIPPEGVNWDKISKEEREEYINQAMNFLYETKRNIKKDK